MKIKFGLKLWSTNTHLIQQAVKIIDEKVFDYIELFVVPDTLISPFLIDIPYIIHIPHHKFRVNIGEVICKEYNLKKIKESIEWADKLNAYYLILHAGHGNLDDAKDLLRELTDNRILIENMPKVGLNNENMIGYSPSHIKEMIGNRNLGLCLDFGHAVKAAVSLGKDYKVYMNDFIGFKPKVFHMSDVLLSNEKDEHLGFSKGELDFEYLLGYVINNNSKFITIETARLNQQSLQEDVLNVEFLKNIIDTLA
jgi:deoxyribonuclease-4